MATTLVHALYHKFYGVVDGHNLLRQGLVSMADAWPTIDWADRHFAEGLGFWEVNVYKALLMWHPVYKSGLGHTKFRKMLAHTLLTLGKVPYGDGGREAGTSGAPAAAQYHHLSALLTTQTSNTSADFAIRAFAVTSTAPPASPPAPLQLMLCATPS